MTRDEATMKAYLLARDCDIIRGGVVAAIADALLAAYDAGLERAAKKCGDHEKWMRREGAAIAANGVQVVAYAIRALKSPCPAVAPPP